MKDLPNKQEIYQIVEDFGKKYWGDDFNIKLDAYPIDDDELFGVWNVYDNYFLNPSEIIFCLKNNVPENIFFDWYEGFSCGENISLKKYYQLNK